MFSCASSGSNRKQDLCAWHASVSGRYQEGGRTVPSAGGALFPSRLAPRISSLNKAALSGVLSPATRRRGLLHSEPTLCAQSLMAVFRCAKTGEMREIWIGELDKAVQRVLDSCLRVFVCSEHAGSYPRCLVCWIRPSCATETITIYGHLWRKSHVS